MSDRQPVGTKRSLPRRWRAAKGPGCACDHHPRHDPVTRTLGRVTAQMVTRAAAGDAAGAPAAPAGPECHPVVRFRAWRDRPLGTFPRGHSGTPLRLIVPYPEADDYKADEVRDDPRVTLVPVRSLGLSKGPGRPAASTGTDRRGPPLRPGPADHDSDRLRQRGGPARPLRRPPRGQPTTAAPHPFGAARAIPPGPARGRAGVTRMRRWDGGAVGAVRTWPHERRP